MSTALKQNSDFQATSLDWLGQFPSRWSVEPGLAVLQERQVKNIGLVEPTVLSLSYGRVVIKPQDKLRGLVPESFETYQIVEPGNIIIRPTDLQNDHVSLRVGQAKDRGIITSAYMCLETRGKLTEDYAHLLLHAYDIKKVFYGLGSGLRQNLSWVDFRRLPIPVPPTEEQAQIVRFIRHLDHRVNRLIKSKRRLIELLNEQKQAVIRELLEGTGEELDRWQIGHFARVGNGSTPYRGNSSYWSDSGDGYPWLNSASVNQFRIGSASQFVSEIALRECHLPKVNPGSILVAITGQGKTRGTAAMLDIEATINQHVAYITVTGDRVQPEYLHLVLVASYQDLRNLSEASGSTKAALTCADIKSFKVPVRERSLQTSLVLQIRTESSKIDQAISKTRDEIELLREYRTRLIADVVTGQLDVRHLDLPEVEESLIEAIDAESEDDAGEVEAEENVIV